MHRFTQLARGATLAALCLLIASHPAGAVAPPPRKARLNSAALTRAIDRALEQRLKAEKVTLSPRADDAEFLRRVYLDLTGHVPPAAKVAPFLDSKNPQKRARLIDELLASKEYGRYMADVWQARLLPRTAGLRFFQQYYRHMEGWLADGFNANKPWNTTVRQLLTAQGKVNEKGPAVYYLANLTADKMTDNFTRNILGVQLQCAQCHNHPFADWRQDEYWGFAAFFMKVGFAGNPRRALRNGGAIRIAEGNRLVRRRLPESAKILPAKFLGGPRPKVNPRQPLRPVLADWVASKDNPFLARAMVNRTWAHFFGRGFVNPVDDLHDANSPSHPKLLEHLTREFAEGSFDVKGLVRAICNSSAYQRTSKPAGNNLKAALELFARVPIKVLSPGQLYDSLQTVLGPSAMPQRFAGRRGPMARRFGFNPRQFFIASFQLEEGADPTEYQAGIPQVLRLMNAPNLNRPALVLPFLRDQTKGPVEVIDRLYIATLARHPSTKERARLVSYVREHADQRRLAYADILWALLNSSEFALNH
jgi:hypothetical protein